MLVDFRAVGRQPLPTSALPQGRHSANDRSRTVLALNHRVVAVFEARKPDISHNIGLHVADIAFRELVVSRIVDIFEELRLRNPSSKTRTFDVAVGQIRFEPFGVIGSVLCYFPPRIS